MGVDGPARLIREVENPARRLGVFFDNCLTELRHWNRGGAMILVVPRRLKTCCRVEALKNNFGRAASSFFRFRSFHKIILNQPLHSSRTSQPL